MGGSGPCLSGKCLAITRCSHPPPALFLGTARIFFSFSFFFFFCSFFVGEVTFASPPPPGSRNQRRRRAWGRFLGSAGSSRSQTFAPGLGLHHPHHTLGEEEPPLSSLSFRPNDPSPSGSPHPPALLPPSPARQPPPQGLLALSALLHPLLDVAHSLRKDG